jgi:hypothetical protein
MRRISFTDLTVSYGGNAYRTNTSEARDLLSLNYVILRTGREETQVHKSPGIGD